MVSIVGTFLAHRTLEHLIIPIASCIVFSTDAFQRAFLTMVSQCSSLSHALLRFVQFATAGVCGACSAYTVSTSYGSSSCFTCPDGTTPNANHDACTNCTAGQRGVSGYCVNCNQNTFSVAGSTACATCPAGYTSDFGAPNCTACAPGTSRLSYQSACTACQAGSYMPDFNATA